MSKLQPALALSKKYTEDTVIGMGAIKGKDGTDGKDGADGKSAYEVAVANGYSGTETEWLASLKGADGADGTNGTNGTDGKDGTNGTDGVSPTITENSGNSDTVYKLDITDANGTFTTPNLKGSDGSGGGEENVIEIVKVNGTVLPVDSDKAVDVTVPTKTSELANDSNYLTEHQDISGKADKTDVETLENTVSKLTTTVSNKADKTDIPTVPTAVSAFTNDANYQTADDVTSTLADYAKTTDIPTVPTKVSELTNDSKYQTETEVSTAISSAVASAYIYKGTVTDSSALPTENLVVGWVYNLEDTGMNVAWNGSEWDNLGATFDLTLYITKDEVSAGYVAKEDGKGLSSNDYTDAEKDAVATIDSKASQTYVDEQLALKADASAIPSKTSDLTNDSGYITSDDVTIESISVNGTTVVPDTDKNVDVTVPSKISELTNDSNYQTASDVAKTLKNYATTDSIPTKVSELTNDSNYQAADDVANTLNDYATTESVNSALESYTNTADLEVLLALKQDKTLVDSVTSAKYQMSIEDGLLVLTEVE